MPKLGYEFLFSFYYYLLDVIHIKIYVVDHIKENWNYVVNTHHSVLKKKLVHAKTYLRGKHKKESIRLHFKMDKLTR